MAAHEAARDRLAQEAVYGGLLNFLTLEFHEGRDEVPISEDFSPAVVIEGKRVRRRFQRVLTRIWNGLVTFCRGSALIHPPQAKPPAASEGYGA